MSCRAGVGAAPFFTAPAPQHCREPVLFGRSRCEAPVLLVTGTCYLLEDSSGPSEDHGENIWISVVLAVILAGSGALLDLGSTLDHKTEKMLNDIFSVRSNID